MAAGDSVLFFSPLSNSPPATSYATLDVRSGFMVLDLDDSVDEQAMFHGQLPSHYGGGQVQTVVTWTSTTGTSGNAKLRVDVTRLTAGVQLDSLPTADGSVELLMSAPATSGQLVVSTSLGINTGGASAGDLLLVSVTRLGADVADTLVGDLELLALEVREV